MELELIAWVNDVAQNGIVQQTPAWLVARETTFGGSTIAALIGLNPYSSAEKTMRQKVGLEKFGGDIKTRWGNLFEDVIKKVFELSHGTRVYGENLYYIKPNTPFAYSPDGLCVMNVQSREQICLVEFKCPFSRNPTKKPPAYYVPQVRMGLSLLDLPSVGILVEAVFRRCTREMFNNGATTTETVPRPPSKPLYKGVVVFWCDGCSAAGMADRDIGAEPIETLAELLEHMTDGNVHTAFTVADSGDPALLARDLYPRNCMPLGYLPWKLLQIVEHTITKEENFLAPHMDKINEFAGLVTACLGRTAEEKEEILTNYFGDSGGFD
jgi:hypothetical protein